MEIQERRMKRKHLRKELGRVLQTGNWERFKQEGPSDQNLVEDCEHEGGAPLKSEIGI